MHNFHTQTCTVQDVRPCIDDMTLTFNNGLIEVESIEVECHGADAEGGKPDSHNWECGKEEVLYQALRVL